jgi:hypothetical protein
MARRSARPQPDQTLELPALTRTCPACGGSLWAAYKAQRFVTTLDTAGEFPSSRQLRIL